MCNSLIVYAIHDTLSTDVGSGNRAAVESGAVAAVLGSLAYRSPLSKLDKMQRGAQWKCIAPWKLSLCTDDGGGKEMRDGTLGTHPMPSVYISRIITHDIPLASSESHLCRNIGI
jgi:hypothetical protein